MPILLLLTAVPRRRAPAQMAVPRRRALAQIAVPRRWAVVLLVALTAALAGCLPDVEHSNPLDPNSDAELAGAVEGQTTRFYPPYSPIENAEVRLMPGPYVVQSQSDGGFVFHDIPAGTYTITAMKEGFASFPDTVTVSLGKATTDVRVRLGGLPVVKSFDLQTIHISRWWPQEDLLLLEILAELEDPDGVGDLSAVWIEVPSHDLARPLEETGIMGRFRLSMPADSLPGSSLHALQGTDMILHVQDAAGFVTESDPETIVRVIDKVPLAEEPQGLSTVDNGRPNLIWENAGLPFEFSYRVDIVRDQANVQTVVETITGIPSGTTSYQIETPLASGTYFWTVSVVDAFGNRSRSKEAGFIVP